MDIIPQVSVGRQTSRTESHKESEYLLLKTRLHDTIKTMLPTYLLLGALGGLHRALWGAYKDSPYEPFERLKFLRSIVIGTIWGGLLFFILCTLDPIPSLAFVYLMTIGLDTITTEFYKLFLRSEAQEKYKIPSQLHFWNKKVSSYLLRLSIGILLSILLGGLFLIMLRLDEKNIQISKLVMGIIIGLTGGFLEAIGGSYKDAPFEGFHLQKFFRSPAVGLAWGVFLSMKQGNLGILLLSVIGANRMTIELYKTFIKGLKSGKFKADTPDFQAWLKKRKIFILPSVLTWIIFILLYLFN